MSGIPDVRIDGLLSVIGAGSCASAATQYRAKINQRMAETEGLSPVMISSHMEVTPATATITATYKLVDPIQLSDLRATLLLYEDNVYWCCGYGGEDTWQHTTRRIYDENITLVNLGDEVTVATAIAIDPSWNPDELHGVAYLQQTTGSKQMIQGQAVGMGAPPDYSLSFRARVASVPEGNGTAQFRATLTNVADEADTFTLEPGSPFGAWTIDYLICGDNTPHSGATQLVLAPDQTCEITVRVHTDGAHEIRQGTFRVTSGFSGRIQETTLRVWNDSPAILLVDDDGSHADEAALISALNVLGYLYEDWDVTYDHGNTSPTYLNMAGFDYVIWHTSWWVQTYPVNDADQAALTSFMEDGGSLFLTSQSFLNYATANSFVTNYLGVASWTLDRGYDHVYGVAGDAIGNGLDLTLSFPYPSFKKGDDAIPGPTAATVLTAPDGSHATIRNTMPGGAKSVFMPFAFNAISEAAQDPNNTRVVLLRILEWLTPQPPAGVEDQATADRVTRFENVVPNPFRSETEIVFNISAAAASGPVRIEIFDLVGRRVAGIFEGPLRLGAHSRAWDGRSETGKPAESGVYLARLTTREGAYSEKLILLR